VFTRDDAAVHAHLAGLSGRVLDLGCGEGPYVERLSAAVAQGRLDYTGIDPDPARIAALAARWPWARLEAATAEDLAARAPPDGAFDHALILRSWNHLKDPAAVLASLARVVRPGGSLLVVDNVAFGLARTARQSRTGERGPAVFEHHRNDDTARARTVIEAAGFSIRRVTDVAPDSSNQWTVEAYSPIRPIGEQGRSTRVA